jgi:hypothetical protein
MFIGQRFFLLFSILTFPLFSQDIKVEYDKNHDFTKYKTFAFGQGEIVTPKDQRVVKDATMHTWVKNAITEELTEKGFMQVDSLGDLVVSYAIGSLPRTDMEQLGPLGQTPGSTNQTWSRDYSQNSLIIDLNNRQNYLVWRINGTTTASGTSPQPMIGEVVSEGFKKLSLKPKKGKKK